MIRPIVEGHGEVEAVPVLLRRILNRLEIHDLPVRPPFRRPRSALVKKRHLCELTERAARDRCSAILVLMDSDDDCPKHLAPQLKKWAQSAAAHIPCEVVLAHREFEAWFLAALESLRGFRGLRDTAVSLEAPEEPRDAKRRLEQFMSSRSYSPKVDQAALAAQFDMDAAYAKCQSFRHLIGSVRQLLDATGREPTDWSGATRKP